MSAVILLGMVLAADDSYAPTEIGRGLWRSPAGFVYHSDKRFTGDELRRQEAAAGFDVGPVRPRTVEEIAAAYGSGSTEQEKIVTTDLHMVGRFRSRRETTNQADSVTAYRPILPSSEWRKPSRPLKQASAAEPRKPRVTAQTPLAVSEDPDQSVAIVHAPSAAIERKDSLPAALLVAVVLGIVVLLGATASVTLVRYVPRTKPQTDFTTARVKPTPGYSKSTVSPSSYKHVRGGYVCPYCSAGPLRASPGGRYFRCPVCDEIADRGREVNTNIRA